MSEKGHISRLLLIKYSGAALIFAFILSANFFLNDFSVWLAQRQWQDLPLSSAFRNYIVNKNIFLGYSYALSGTFAYLCLFNLVTVNGDLRKSIRGITFSAILWLLICFLTGCCGSPMLSVYLALFGSRFLGFTKPLVAGVTTISILYSFYYVMRFQNRNVLFGGESAASGSMRDNPFEKIREYRRGALPVRIIRHFLMTLFRLFPNPSPVGLYRFGNPDRNAPVLVTSNYALTLDRVAFVLREINCYLLVVDGKGVNVWCSAGAGHLTTDNIAAAIKLSNIENYVDHRTIILPQFAAVGVCSQELKQQTAWSFVFGPAYITDLPEFLLNDLKKTREMCLAKFGFRDRLEMAVGCALISVIVIVSVMVFVNPQALILLIPLLYLQSVLFAAAEPYLPRRWLVSGAVYSAFWGILTCAVAHAVFQKTVAESLVYCIPIVITGFYLPNEFLGWSPLIKYNWQVLLKGAWEAKISVHQEKCIGCGLCVDVCPTGVFELNNRKSTVVSPEQCEGCKACFMQCPVDAVAHSLRTEKDSCACIYCGIQKNLK